MCSLDLSLSRLCGLLGLDELGIVDVAVLVLVVGRQDRVDHVHELVVLEDLLLGERLATVFVVIRVICAAAHSQKYLDKNPIALV